MNFLQTTNVTKATELKLLSLGLSEFGLQPFDWLLIKNTENQIKIQHKQEPSFYFIGKTISKDGEKKWNSIQLGSL
ncbi:MAG: hypothetical protein H7328_05135 [Bdellovibrio sp.]|nr:hypothetical protein [Bdellovibrio sp.]